MDPAKQAVATILSQTCATVFSGHRNDLSIEVDPNTISDVVILRIHQYPYGKNVKTVQLLPRMAEAEVYAPEFTAMCGRVVAEARAKAGNKILEVKRADPFGEYVGYQEIHFLASHPESRSAQEPYPYRGTLIAPGVRRLKKKNRV